MLLLLLACSSAPTGLGITASPKEATDTADTGDTAQDTGDTSDTADTSDTGDSADTADTADSASCDSADSGCTSGRLGKSAAELSDEPGGFGCNSAAGPWLAGWLGLLVIAGRVRYRLQ